MAKLEDIKACVFDAYGTLFDVHSAVAGLVPRLGNGAQAVSAMWRAKQLEYTWLRSLMREYADFWQVTGDALDYALESQHIADPALREDLMQAYLSLDCYQEVPRVLERLRDARMRTAILSNGSPAMLGAAVRSAALGALIDDVWSVDDLRVYKPHPAVYRLAVDALGVAAREICFLSSNAFDVAGAAVFGFQVVWINRFDQNRERLPGDPAALIRTLDEIEAIVLHGN